MKPPKYLKAFQSLPEALDIPGDGMLVEQVPEEEVKTKSGLIMATASGYKATEAIAANKPKFVHVLAVGKGYYDDDTGEDVPLSVKPGDIILVGQTSVRWFGFLDIEGYEPFSIGVCRESEIQMRFQGIEQYRATFGAINKALESKVDA